MNMVLSTPYMTRPDRIDRICPLKLMVFMTDSLGPSCWAIPHKYFYSPICGMSGIQSTLRLWMAALNRTPATRLAAVWEIPNAPISFGIRPISRGPVRRGCHSRRTRSIYHRRIVNLHFESSSY